ncbi:MAG: glycosyltransferase family 2 protein, partial [bacterium]|nr:glycosyltransferase family 2 protein [bacterium]
MSATDSSGGGRNGGEESKPSDKPLISIVVPVFNEEDNVDRTHAELKRVAAELTDYRFEFLFTDNHSTDSTFEKLTRIAARDPEVRIARFSRNFGFQQSVLTGYRLARGAAAIQIDADLQDPPSMFGPFLEKWREGYDVVVGVRRSRKEGLLLRRARRAYYRLMRSIGGPHLIPDGGDFRLIDRSVIERLRPIHEPHMYLRGLISSLARRQTGIPFDRSAR